MNASEQPLILYGTPEHEQALQRADEFDAETQRMAVPFLKFFWLLVTGHLCWRCKCQAIDASNDLELCLRCQEIMLRLEDIQ